MALVECRLGYAEVPVAGTYYSFDRDRHGRFVAKVHSRAHVAILTAVEHFVVVPDEPPAPAAPPPPPPPPAQDDLTAIRGIGPSMQEKLRDAGYASFAAIAAMSPDDVTALDARLKLHGAAERHGWIAQAAALAAGKGQEG